MGARESTVKKIVKGESDLLAEKIASLQDQINKTNQSLQDQIIKTNQSVGNLNNSIAEIASFTSQWLPALANQNKKMDVQIKQTAKRMKRLEDDYYGYRSIDTTSIGSDGEDTWDAAYSADVVLNMQ